MQNSTDLRTDGPNDAGLVENHALMGTFDIDTEGSRETTNQNSYAEGFEKQRNVANSLFIVKKHVQNKSNPALTTGFKTFDPR